VQDNPKIQPRRQTLKNHSISKRISKCSHNLCSSLSSQHSKKLNMAKTAIIRFLTIKFWVIRMVTQIIIKIKVMSPVDLKTCELPYSLSQKIPKITSRLISHTWMNRMFRAFLMRWNRPMAPTKLSLLIKIKLSIRMITLIWWNRHNRKCKKMQLIIISFINISLATLRISLKTRINNWVQNSKNLICRQNQIMSKIRYKSLKK